LVGPWNTEDSENLAVGQEIPRRFETPKVLLPRPQQIPLCPGYVKGSPYPRVAFL